MDSSLSNFHVEKQNNDAVVIILGMHRSGTSCLTGLLQQAGVYLGEVVEEAPHNRKGNRENLPIRDLNDEVLSFNQAGWDSPPVGLIWNSAHQANRDVIIQSYRNVPVWGFKDPRTVLTLPFWLEGLQNQEIRFIGTFRHPLAVAKSLNARQPDFTISSGIELWKSYNEKMMEIRAEFEFPLIDFDLEPAPYLEKVRTATKIAKILSVPMIAKLDFFDEQLRHQTDLEPDEIDQFRDELAGAMPLYQRLLHASC